MDTIEAMGKTDSRDSGPSSFDAERRRRTRRALGRASNACLLVALLALPVIAIQPAGMALPVAFGALVLCLVLRDIRRRI